MGYKFYFQFTLTTYDNLVEINVTPKEDIINIFIKLSEIIGRDKLIWRYDPILINKKYSEEYHQK